MSGEAPRRRAAEAAPVHNPPRAAELPPEPPSVKQIASTSTDATLPAGVDHALSAAVEVAIMKMSSLAESAAKSAAEAAAAAMLAASAADVMATRENSRNTGDRSDRDEEPDAEPSSDDESETMASILRAAPPKVREHSSIDEERLSRSSAGGQTVVFFSPDQPSEISHDHESPAVAPERTDRPPKSQRRRRLVRRDHPFHQSSGKIYMRRSGWSNKALVQLGVSDWFHVMLGLPLWAIILIAVILYTLVILVFAGFYKWIDGKNSQCGLAPPNETLTFLTAFSFSLETMTTIGYGIPYDQDAFFNRCWTMPFAVYCQALIFIVSNAAFLGIIFARVGRAQTRASQIIFSDKAVIRCVRGRFFFNFQVGEASYIDYNPVVEAHVRVYAVLHEQTGGRTKAGNEEALFQTRVVRITNPNDELGGMLFLATPQLVSHRIDRWSPLFPPDAFEVGKHTRTQEGNHIFGVRHDGGLYAERPVFPGLVAREEDLDAEELIEKEIERRKWVRRRFNARKTNPNMIPPSVSGDVRPRQGFNADPRSLMMFREAVRHHIRKTELEVIVVVEAIDPSSSNTFQARHSYTNADIQFDHGFSPTMSIASDGSAQLDWDAFHRVQPVPFNGRVVVGSSHS